MSGFVSVVGRDQPVDHALLNTLLAPLASIGPDGREVAVDGPAGLGCSPLVAGEGPGLLAEADDLWLAADARLTRRPALREALRTAGHPAPPDASDAHLLLAAYRCWGEACVEHLQGDFAFIMWDRQRRCLFGVRDVFGAIPFFYAQHEGRLICSDALQAIRAYPGLSATLDDQAVGDYLLVGYGLDRAQTFFEAVHALPPAHALRWQDGTLTVYRYWQPEPLPYLSFKDPADYVEAFREAWEAAVADGLQSDRVYATMSGGLDSPSIAVTAHRLIETRALPVQLEAFSVGFDWLLPDHERYFAGLVTHQTGIPTHFLSAEPYLQRTPLGETWGTPLPPQPHFPLRPPPMTEVFERAVREGVTTVFTGLGGDAALGAVPTYWRDALADRRLGDLLRWARLHRALTGSRPPLYRKRPPADRLRVSDLTFIRPDVAQRLGLQERLDATMTQSRTQDGREQLYLHPMWTTIAAASHPAASGLPLRMRHPFFDAALVELLRQMPPIPWLVGKRLLREAMRGHLPEAVRKRPKRALQGHFAYANARRGYEPHLPALAQVPTLAAYVDVDALQAAVADLDRLPSHRFSTAVLLPLSLAFWLDRSVYESA